ncbi:MAG TPA: FemAB family XrtA/PEP-CTERM system-associated protein [Oleiagrimonas sp.]|nr:FemAB family XrtA/PEP-CTERM system-associated protein [Oleiagrimonas sp.]
MLDCVNNDRVSKDHGADICSIRHLTDADAGRWDAFVESMPQGTFFHRVTWRDIIENSLGHRSHYLYAESRGVITGVLPLAEIRSWLFGHALISTPFCVYGGVVAVDAESETRLTEAAVALADELRVDYLELRDRQPDHPEWPVKDLYVSFRKAIEPDHDSNLKAIPRKQRAMVRKGIKAGLEADHKGDLDAFYQVYAESVRNLGTPVLPRKYYARLKQAFGKNCEITVVTHQGQPVAAVMSFYFRDEVHPYYGGSIWSGRALAANDFMYWAVMKRAVERGARLFDFGRSKLGTGSCDFKKHWGFEPQPLPYAYHLVRAAHMPNISPTNGKYRLFIKAWQRLPLQVSRTLGPWLARDLG